MNIWTLIAISFVLGVFAALTGHLAHAAFIGSVLRVVGVFVIGLLIGAVWPLVRRKLRAPRRDVSTLAGDEASQTSEVIKRSGPLKPRHKRSIIRDQRLLPKPKPDPAQWYLRKKENVMSADEAGRLFSLTMRTQDREIRDLATDEAQLARYKLPIWRNEEELAGALGIDVKTLRYFSIHRYQETCPHYYVFAIPKRRGGERLIHAPKKKLKAIQRRLNALLVNKLVVSHNAHGFVTGRSVASNAAQHVGKKLVVKFDIKDCFPSLHFGRVRGLFISLGYGYPVATTLAVLMTEAQRQPVKDGNTLYHIPIGERTCPQGAPTSPGLCNAILLRLDRRLAGLAKKLGFAYSRYADDLTFSGDDDVALPHLMHLVAKIAKEEGFDLNLGKTCVMRRGGRQSVTGVVVNDRPGLSRKDRRKIRASIHRLKTSPEMISPEVLAELAGKVAYVSMLNREQGAALKRQLQDLERG